MELLNNIKLEELGLIKGERPTTKSDIKDVELVKDILFYVNMILHKSHVNDLAIFAVNVRRGKIVDMVFGQLSDLFKLKFQEGCTLGVNARLYLQATREFGMNNMCAAKYFLVRDLNSEELEQLGPKYFKTNVSVLTNKYFSYKDFVVDDFYISNQDSVKYMMTGHDKEALFSFVKEMVLFHKEKNKNQSSS